eukprot:TRINITY_DN66244_c0_g1_i1.p1 TRINITY_DN66244_c0_g1~~TRINITY_DN66244_c0_g1_i1.p1  ORF type:complete len:366 (+),score=40.41 TRINITY_DN66244_c0_g1_i1:54-1100(+)
MDRDADVVANGGDAEDEQPPRKRQRQEEQPDLRLLFFSHVHEIDDDATTTLSVKDLAVDTASRFPFMEDQTRQLFGRRDMLRGPAVFTEVLLPTPRPPPHAARLLRFVSRTLFSISALRPVPTVIISCQSRPDLLREGEEGVPVMCRRLSGAEVGVFIVPPHMPRGSWLGGAVRGKLGALAPHRLTLVESDGRILWEDLPPGRLDLQSMRSVSSQPDEQSRQKEEVRVPQESEHAHASSDEHDKSQTQIATDLGSEVPAKTATATQTSHTRCGSSSLLADIIGLSSAGLHVRSHGSSVWRWLPHGVACWIRAGDQIAILLANEFGDAAEKCDTEVERSRCLVGLEVLP